MDGRSYADPCGIARALDAVGERWGLLVVRELLHGPKRFRDLQRELTGISPTVLTQRLDRLSQAGVITPVRLPPPSGATAYGLTAEGAELEPVLVALSGWGRRRPLPADGELSPDALVLALRTTFVPARAPAGQVVVDLQLERDPPDRFTLVADRDGLHADRIPRAADLVVRTTPAVLRELAFRGRTVAAAVADGGLQVDGDPVLLQAVLDAVERPEPAAAASG